MEGGIFFSTISSKNSEKIKSKISHGEFNKENLNEKYPKIRF